MRSQSSYSKRSQILLNNRQHGVMSSHVLFGAVRFRLKSFVVPRSSLKLFNVKRYTSASISSHNFNIPTFEKHTIHTSSNKAYTTSMHVLSKALGMNTGGCPFLSKEPVMYPGLPPPEIQKDYAEALEKVDWPLVKKDLKDLFRDSKEWWPADYGHYGGFFIRLAWHTTGTYRQSDGRGGADGGNQRFNPELSWPDNGNLVHAHKLLEPIKHKHGLGLSWGDLFVMSGTVAIEDMGGPVLGFAAGRIDHVDNSQTISLGPSPEQEKFKHVEVNGAAEAPLGQNTLGLIYVNPEGPMGEPDPQGAADTIRDVFGRMGMNDRENVALIGGGHTFGKCHGAGPEGPGPSPEECPHNPYPGMHGTGKGKDAVTSGLEGPWTSNPTGWDNEYFKNLLNFEWEKHKGPGGKWQWRVKGAGSPKAPAAHSGGPATQDIMMLTTDVALAVDPEYRKYVEEFANDEKAFADAFAAVWYKLVNRDMGPVSRMVGPEVAPAQEFQFPLPAPPAKLADTNEVEKELSSFMDANSGKGEFIRLAVNSAGTFRHTDYMGGCNGARIRFSPGKDWKSNAGLDKTLELLEPIKSKFGDSLSWADLIVLAGNVAAKRLGAPKDLPFCPGRTDASDGKGWDHLEYGNAEPPTTVEDVLDRNTLRGLTTKDYVALCFTNYPSVAALKKLCATKENEDMTAQALKYRPEFKQWVDYYISSGDKLFTHDFACAWSKLMNMDRFDGPVKNLSSRDA